MGDLLTMKLTTDIYMNYQMMEEKADRLEELANELYSVAEKSIGCYGENCDSWKGDSGDECRKKAKSTVKEITRMTNTNDIFEHNFIGHLFFLSKLYTKILKLIIKIPR